MMTDRSANEPYMYKSQLVHQRMSDKKMSFYDELLESDKTNTIRYSSSDELNPSSDSYSEFLDKGGAPLDIFQ